MARTQEIPASTSHWLAAALVVITVLWSFAWYRDTAYSMIAMWRASQTYAHGFLIVPISLWLMWRRRDEVALAQLRPNFFVIPLLALTGFGWLLGQLAGVVVAQQYALVAMAGLLVWTIGGDGIARTLAFPLCFLFFAVPFGEVLIPPLMDLTANVTVFALSASGIPVYREGLYFVTPTGTWSIVDSCSGLNFLIVCTTGGTLYAYLRYRRFQLRAIFVAAAVSLPVVANSLRTYLIVMIDYATNKQVPIATNHILYGWLLFGVLVLLLFWVGSYWREDVDAPPITATNAAQRQSLPLNHLAAASIVVASLVTVWPVTASWLQSVQPNRQTILQEPRLVTGWGVVEPRVADWSPRFVNPAAVMDLTYANSADGRRVGLFIAYYNGQRPGAELISSVNVLVPGTVRNWVKLSENHRAVVSGDSTIPAIEARLRVGFKSLLVWEWYWIDGQYTANPYWAKLLQAKSKLLGRGDPGAAVVVYTEAENDRDSLASAQVLQEFIAAMLPGITRSLEHAR